MKKKKAKGKWWWIREMFFCCPEKEQNGFIDIITEKDKSKDNDAKRCTSYDTLNESINLGKESVMFSHP